ncbi:MAG: DASS family sodium-coupled anion symporter [Clostridiales bacterium]|nr:DASS family sodium-coupled anion symporter [Clostridiales bacterium]
MPKISAELKRGIALIAVVAAYIIIMAIPTPAGLTPEGQRAIAMMVCVVICWVTEVVPILITSVLFIFVTYLLGLNSESGAVKDFASPTVFFVFASMLLAYALENSGLNKRLALNMTVLSKGKPKLLILFMMFGTAILSTIISNVPSCAAFFFIVKALCEQNNCERGTSNFAKAGIIGVIFGAMVGGNATPAGSSLNVLGLNLLRQSTGMSLSFSEWTLFGLPIVIVMVPILWFIIIKVFPPEFELLAGVEDSKKELEQLGKLTKQEIKFMVISVLMLTFWFTEKYLHNISVSASTMAFATLYFCPGINLLTYEYVKDKLDWTLIIMIGASGTFGAAMFNTGASSWLANTFLGPFTNSSPLILAFVIATFCTVIKILIPSNPACVTIMVPTLAAFSLDTGIPLMMLYLPMAFTISASWLLPFDPVPVICWPDRYFSIKDFFKAGIWGHIALIFVAVAVVMIIGTPLGYFR